MKIKQSETAIAHYRKPDTQEMIRTHEQLVRAILAEHAPHGLTLKEITTIFNELTGFDVPDSSICAPLNLLKARGEITDENPKRPCRINRIRKKVWSFIFEDENVSPNG